MAKSHGPRLRLSCTRELVGKEERMGQLLHLTAVLVLSAPPSFHKQLPEFVWRMEPATQLSSEHMEGWASIGGFPDLSLGILL